MPSVLPASLAFFANTIPTMPQASPINAPQPKNANTAAIIPRTKVATALL